MASWTTSPSCGQCSRTLEGAHGERVGCRRGSVRIHGHGLRRLLKGAFCAAILDRTTGVLALVDRPVRVPIRCTGSGPRIAWCSHRSFGLRSESSVAPAFNAAAVADYLKFAFVLGDKTFAAGVEMVPAASTLTYRMATHDVPSKRMRELADLSNRAI